MDAALTQQVRSRKLVRSGAPPSQTARSARGLRPPSCEISSDIARYAAYASSAAASASSSDANRGATEGVGGGDTGGSAGAQPASATTISPITDTCPDPHGHTIGHLRGRIGLTLHMRRYGGPVTVPGPWQRAARGAMLLNDEGELRPTIFAEMSALAARTGVDQPRPGLPRRGRPRRGAGGRPPSHLRRRQPVPARPRHPAAARGDRRPPEALLRPRRRPRARGAGHRRRDRGDRGDPARAGRRGRRGRHSRAVLRLLRRDDRASRAAAT